MVTLSVFLSQPTARDSLTAPSASRVAKTFCTTGILAG